jgi:hypothetical protein
MKRCELYQAHKRNKKAAALGKVPKAAAMPAVTLPAQSIPPIEAPDFSAPLREFEQAMREYSTKQNQPPTPQQRRREMCQAAKTQVIDRYRTSVGQVTDSLRGGAKLAIERELASMPLEELPFEEVLEIAAATRERSYVPEFKRQAREAERRNLKEKAQRRAELEALGKLLRADRRRKIYIEQASNQARAYCEEKAITGWAKLSVLGDIESRLEEFLTGDEPILESQAIVRSVLEARFEEAEATLAAAQVKEDEKWREDVVGLVVLGALVAVSLLALRYPEQVELILGWIERTFGFTPDAEAAAPTPEEAETPTPAASPEARPPIKRRRKDPVAPPGPESSWGNAVGGEPAHA